MFFHDTADREPKELVPGVLARTYWIEKMLAAVVDLEPQAEIPVHSHPHEQLGIVLDGKIELTIGGETKKLKPGDVYLIPSGIEHAAKTFDDSAKVMDVFSPVREEYKY